jgi:drug/metabolite transporter (DMT)-like permease
VTRRTPTPASTGTDFDPGPPLRRFRAATTAVGVETVVALGFALYLLLRSAFGSPHNRSEGVYIGIYLLILAVGMVAVARGMYFERRWSRSPAIVVNIVVTGIGWYLFGGDHTWIKALGVVAMLTGVAVIVTTGAPSVYRALEVRFEERTGKPGRYTD